MYAREVPARVLQTKDFWLHNGNEGMKLFYNELHEHKPAVHVVF